jgi:hypothetical protein
MTRLRISSVDRNPTTPATTTNSLVLDGFPGGFHRLGVVVDLLEQYILDLAPGRRLFLVEQADGLVAIGLGDVDRLGAGRGVRLPQRCHVADGRDGRGIGASEGSRLQQGFVELLGGRIEVLVRLRVLRIENDVAKRLAALQALRIHLRIRRKPSLVAIDEAGEAIGDPLQADDGGSESQRTGQAGDDDADEERRLHTPGVIEHIDLSVVDGIHER